jgi:hypothetical protein
MKSFKFFKSIAALAVLVPMAALAGTSNSASEPDLQWKCTGRGFESPCQAGTCFPQPFSGSSFLTLADNVQAYFAAEQNAKNNLAASCKAAGFQLCAVEACVAPNGDEINFN